MGATGARAGGRLAGLRVAALVADGFEQVELTAPLKALRRDGAIVEVVSLRPGKVRGMNMLVPGKKVAVDYLVREAPPERYDALLLPGGFIGPDFLRRSREALAFVRAFQEAGKPMAVICHGPWVLASAGIAEGRRLTSWPGIRDDMENAGARWEDRAVVRDGNLVTSRGPQDMRAFVRAMREAFAACAPQAARAPRPAGPLAALWALMGAAGALAGYLLGARIYDNVSQRDYMRRDEGAAAVAASERWGATEEMPDDGSR